MRKSSTDRPPLTADEWAAVNRWRQELLQIQKTPMAFGIGATACPNGIPDDLIIGVDETPLHYIPCANGTYVTGNEAGVFIAGLPVFGSEDGSFVLTMHR